MNITLAMRAQLSLMAGIIAARTASRGTPNVRHPKSGAIVPITELDLLSFSPIDRENIGEQLAAQGVRLNSLATVPIPRALPHTQRMPVRLVKAR